MKMPNLILAPFPKAQSKHKPLGSKLFGDRLGMTVLFCFLVYPFVSAQTIGDDALKRSLSVLTGKQTGDYQQRQKARIQRTDDNSRFLDLELDGDEVIQIQTPKLILRLDTGSGQLRVLNGESGTPIPIGSDRLESLRPTLALDPFWAISHVLRHSEDFAYEAQATALRFSRNRKVLLSDPEQGRLGILEEELLLDPVSYEPLGYRFETWDPEGRQIRHIEVQYMVRSVGDVLAILPPFETDDVVYQYGVRF